MNIAFFDFDGTITRRDSFALFLRHILGQKFYVKLAQNLHILLLYKLGFVSNSRAKESVLHSCLRGISEGELQAHCAKFLPILDGICKDSALARIVWHKEQGDRVVLVSASFEEYLGVWVRKIGIEVIATKMEVQGGKLTGKLATPNCYGAQKVARIRAQIDLAQFDEIYAYGDTRGDKEMLEIAQHAFYRAFE